MPLKPRKNPLLCRTRPVEPVDPVQDAIDTKIARVEARQQSLKAVCKGPRLVPAQNRTPAYETPRPVVVGSTTHRLAANQALANSLNAQRYEQVLELALMMEED
jgi:hypothetical protein